jgi:hypothetical protein
MKIQKYTNPANCATCGKTAISLVLELPLSKELLAFLMSNGYQELKHMTKSGIFYVEGSGLVATGMMGGTTLTLKCKVKECQKHIADLETLLTHK